LAVDVEMEFALLFSAALPVSVTAAGVVVATVEEANDVDEVLTTTSAGRAGLTGVGVAGLVVEFSLDMMMTVEVLPDLCSGM
jgi:hypothetical protein